MYELNICGHCKFRRFYDDEWRCSNPDSDYCGLEMQYEETCFDFEEK